MSDLSDTIDSTRERENIMRTIEFVSYNGSYPNLCSGTLVLRVDGKEVTIGQYGAISSGGSVWFDEEWTEHVEDGDWSLGYSDEYDQFTLKEKSRILDLVNENIPCGCCGGCV